MLSYPSAGIRGAASCANRGMDGSVALLSLLYPMPRWVVDINMIFRGEDADKDLIPAIHGAGESLQYQKRFARSESRYPILTPFTSEYRTGAELIDTSGFVCVAAGMVSALPIHPAEAMTQSAMRMVIRNNGVFVIMIGLFTIV